jgi:hypothetical protein
MISSAENCYLIEKVKSLKQGGYISTNFAEINKQVTIYNCAISLFGINIFLISFSDSSVFLKVSISAFFFKL